MMTSLFQIPEGHRVLLGHSGNEDDSRWFEQSFLEVWRRLPSEDRSVAVELWRNHGGLTIAVMGDWIGRGCRSAECIEPGDKLRFFDAHVARMSDITLGFTIAHELAHVFLLATDAPSHVRYFSSAAMEEDREQCEQAVRTTMRRWGEYDENAIAQAVAVLTSQPTNPDVR